MKTKEALKKEACLKTDFSRSTGFKLFYYFSGSTGFLGSTFGAFERLFEEVTGYDVTIRAEMVCGETFKNSKDCLLGCLLVCLLDCGLFGNEIVWPEFSSSVSM